ncbi:hypothetical protein COL154_001043 [Colletotrichum chrysophilum]|uniref:Zn(2)-C6 fungal-type domain-containing protein n=1 Tax=Colletotrichum chrysophilum TaxID=1836956 RepID=A0AAD9A069_9PEZI|nr:uncharacterized protein COL26b_008525 [Colletotrichum chrysophilum]KAJ0370669.1 hypothetical protein COL154_001043 [Colletotrichum chrysophilum]KAJ0373282.1 hypothetical protein COL26b_008525 [Colletotrichum chrysophilum]KAK1837742.1 hypothetical protein CCHR01_19635 [Colletotrichum chrysophilum]
MDYQSQNEQFMERGVTQAGSDDVVSSNNEIHPQAFPPATHEEFFNFHVEEEDVFFYERLTEALRIDAQSPPNNLLDAEQDMVAVATDEANNEQASFYSQARPQANYDDISRRLSREEMDAYSRDILGPNNLLGFEGDMRVNNGQTPFLSQAYPQLPSVPQPSRVPAAQNIDPRLMESMWPGPAPISNNGNGNGNNEGNGNDKGSSNNNFGVGAPPQPLIVPEALKPNTAGNRVKKQAATKRKVSSKSCSNCRTSKLRCTPDEDRRNACLKCVKDGLSCDMGRTTDKRTRETNRDKLLRTVEGCKKYLADLLILIYSINIANDQGKLNDKIPMIRSQLSQGLPGNSVLFYAVTQQHLTPQYEQRAQACVRLDALAGLQLDLEGIENNLAKMRKTVNQCVGKTKELVRMLGRYLHVLMDDEDHFGDAEISLRTVRESQTPFSQIDTDMKVQFSYIADNSDLVTSLVGHVDKLKAA